MKGSSLSSVKKRQLSAGARKLFVRGLAPPNPPQDPKALGHDQIRQEELGQVKCEACGILVNVPVSVAVFQCQSCQHVTSRILAPISSVDDLTSAELYALNRWLIWNVIDKEVSSWMSTTENSMDAMSKLHNPTNLMEYLVKKVVEFPMLRNLDPAATRSIIEAFQIVPNIERQLVNARGRGNKRRLTNLLYGPLFYSTFGAQSEPSMAESRGDLNMQFKQSLIDMLQSVSLVNARTTSTSKVAGRNNVGLDRLLEAIESSHNVRELPELAYRAFTCHVFSATANMEHSLAKPGTRSKLKTLYHLFPRRSLLAILRLNMGGGVASAALNLFFARPLGTLNMLQRLVSTSLGLAQHKARVRSLKTQLGKQLFEWVEGNLTVLHSDLSDAELVSLYCSKNQNTTKLSSEQCDAIRQVVEELDFVANVKQLVSIAGDAKVEALISHIVPAIQQQLMASITSKGSGFSEMVEFMFGVWGSVLKIHNSSAISGAQKHIKYIQLIEALNEHVYTVVHNMLRADPTGIWHETLRWLFETWENADMQIDTRHLIRDVINVDELDGLRRDCSVAHDFYKAQASRVAGTMPRPPPPLPTANKLVYSVTSKVVEAALLPEENDTEASQSTRPSFKSLFGVPDVHVASEEVQNVITNLEVVLDCESTDSLVSRGYHRLHGPGYVSAYSGKSAQLWIRSVGYQQSTTLANQYPFLAPIEAVQVSRDKSECEALVKAGFYWIRTKIGKCWILYRRRSLRQDAQGNSVSPVLTQMEVHGVNGPSANQLRERGFQPSSHHLVAAHGRFAKGQSIQLWCQYLLV